MRSRIITIILISIIGFNLFSCKINSEVLEKKFKKYTTKGMGKYRIKNIDKSKHPYKEYSTKVIEDSPKTILELSTGAGSGTSAVARVKDKDAIMEDSDEDFLKGLEQLKELTY